MRVANSASVVTAVAPPPAPVDTALAMTDPPAPATDPALQVALSARLKVALRAAEEAGAILMSHLGHLTRIDNKSPIDLVTVADRDSEARILSELCSAFPDDRVLAEERDGADGAAALAGEVAALPFCWLVDPLDGTTNFAHGYPQFAVSMGLLHYGQPVLGVVLAPARREIFVGGLGVRATCNGRMIRVSKVDALASALLATGFPYDRRERLPQLLHWLGGALMAAHGVRRAGSAALDLCELAAGRLDGYYEVGLAPWDVCAGQAIVAAAGGMVSDFGGGEHDLFGRQVLVSNGLLHLELQRLVAA